MKKNIILISTIVMCYSFISLSLAYSNSNENFTVLSNLHSYSLCLLKTPPISTNSSKATFEEKLKAAGLIDVQSISPTIKVNLKYSTTDNFMKTDVYGALNKVYLLKSVAKMLANSQKYLKAINPDYSLLVYDGARPLSVQYKMWNIVKGTPMQNYVGNPVKGSMHNFGAAVDLTIVTGNGTTLDMGTPFDYLGSLAEPTLEKFFLAKGKLTKKQVNNRELLRKVMLKASFKGISNEWWHFNAYVQKWTRKNLKLIK